MSLKIALPNDIARCQNSICSIKENCHRHTTKQVDTDEQKRFMVHHEFTPKQAVAGTLLELSRDSCPGFIQTPHNE
ncbi:MAG: hypothetical protein N4A41_00490 [Crocinitomicaceae bacterium]|jgi:hypothetical protein|nr:hypothetical protein [Crocinitomicaceae bacterium]